MNVNELAIVRRWLRENRGEQSQQDLADAITAATGWNITRDRYSKYESGSLPIGPTVLRHFVDYWASRDVAGPDFTPPLSAPSIEERTLAAMDRQTDAIKALADELLRWRTEDRVRLAQVEAMVDQVAGAVLAEPDTPVSTARRTLRETAE